MARRLQVKDLVKKHSEFISFPIYLLEEKTKDREVEDEDEDEEMEEGKGEEEEGPGNAQRHIGVGQGGRGGRSYVLLGATQGRVHYCGVGAPGRGMGVYV